MKPNNESGPGASADFVSVCRGPPKRSKPWVACNCTRSLWTIFLVISLPAAYFVYNTIHTKYSIAKNPHRALYQDLTVKYGQKGVVHPLVDANQTFDIVATVWLRDDAREPPENVTKDGTPVWRNPSALVETAIFTETIFRGLRLRDKDVRTAVNFRVPTEIFKKKELHTYDLRGSFALVPNSPSPLDDVLNYSSWIPPFITYPPSISWPDGHRPSAAELLVNAYGTFTPLLSFHNVKSRCGSPQKPGDQKDTDKVEGDEEESTSNRTPVKLEHPFPTKGPPPLESHPYIITRTFLRVVDMAPLYNEAAFKWAQRRLKSNACSKRRDWTFCARSFFTNGHQEFKILLRKKDEPKEKDSDRWAYAPYLTVADTPVAPLDLVPVPVNREECSNNGLPENSNVPDEDFVDITWNVAFSGRTPEKLLAADYLPKINVKYDMTDMESHDLGLAHNGIELMQGVVGQRFHDDYHPRRAAFFIGVGHLIEIFQFILALHYWLCLASTVGVSITGNALIAVAGILDGLFGAIFQASRKGYTGRQFFRALYLHAAFHILSYSILKGITRIKFRLSKRWIPTVYFAPASHAERTSQRLDSRTTWRFKIPVFVTLASFFQLCYSQHFYIINRATRGPSIPKAPVLNGIFTLHTFTVTPALILGRILQLILNFRGRKFSGKYKICAILDFLGSLFAVAAAAPPIVGRSIRSFGLDVEKGSELVAIAALAFQAVWYPVVSPADEDEDLTSR